MHGRRDRGLQLATRETMSLPSRKPVVRRVRESVRTPAVVPRHAIRRIAYEEDSDLLPTKVGARTEVAAASRHESGFRELLSRTHDAADLLRATLPTSIDELTRSSEHPCPAMPPPPSGRRGDTEPDESSLSALLAVYEERVEQMRAMAPPPLAVRDRDRDRDRDRRRAKHVLGNPSLLAIVADWIDR